MKKIIIFSILLLTSTLYAQTMFSTGYGAEYNYSTITSADEPFGILSILVPGEEGDPAHTITGGVRGEISVLRSNGFTFGGEASLNVGLSSKAMFEANIQIAPIIGYSFLTKDLMQIYFTPVNIAFSPFYAEKNITGGPSQILDFRTGLHFTFSELGRRNETADGFILGAHVKWGQFRFNSMLNGYRSDIGFGISFFTRDIEFDFND